MKSINPVQSDCIILGKWVFEKFILADEPFEKALRSLETCVSVNNILSGKLVSSLEVPIKFNERFLKCYV